MPDPSVVFAMFNAYQQTEALRTAVELELFTAIGSGVATADALAAHLQAPARGLRMLCDFLSIHGLLSKQDGQYALSPVAAAFLDKKSPAYLGSMAQFLTADTIRDAFRGLTGAVRRGGTILGEHGTMAADHPVWVDFARVMTPMMTRSAQAIASILATDGGPVREVLDVAAGHGIFGIHVAQRFTEARITAVDWAAVLEVARENAARAGVSERLRTLPGSAFDVDLGSGYDVILVTNFIHHFDPETMRALARRFHAALAEGGRMITLAMIPNPDRVSPPPQAGFALTMLATTPRGDAYTFAEYERTFAESGFTRSVLHDLAPVQQRVIMTYK